MTGGLVPCTLPGKYPDCPGHPAGHCPGHSTSTYRGDAKGRPCGLSAGAGTDHLGYGLCKHHGGSTPNARQQAKGQQARDLLGTLGVVDDPSRLPVPVVHAELQLSAAKQLAAVRWLEQQVGALPVERAGDSVWTKLLRQQRRDCDDLLVRLAHLGINEARLRLEGRRVDAMVLLIQRVLANRQAAVEKAVGHPVPELSPETVGPLVHAELLALGGEIA